MAFPVNTLSQAQALFLQQFDPRSPIWRRRLRCASFKGVPFYVDQQGQGSGRRTVTHEYPKRDIPYAEDMGRLAYRYQMTGYLITIAGGIGVRQVNGMAADYSLNRDPLRAALDSIGPGILNDPYNPDLQHLGYPLQFMCERYTCSESRERGGYCVFEMSFVEAGLAAGTPQTTTMYTDGVVKDAAAAAAAAAGVLLDQFSSSEAASSAAGMENTPNAPGSRSVLFRQVRIVGRRL